MVPCRNESYNGKLTCKVCPVLSAPPPPSTVDLRGIVTTCPERPSSARSSGQSLVEFAIVFPVLMLIIAAIIQFGIIFWGQNTLTQVARDTGRWAASQQGCTSGSVDVIGTAKAIAANSSLIGNSSGW